MSASVFLSKCRRLFMPAIVVLILTTGFDVTAAQTAQVTLDCALTPFDPACSVSSSEVTPEKQQLVDRYIPIVMLKQQRYECDTEGEPYLPAPVEVVFNDPESRLRQRTGSGSDPVIMDAPGLSDIAGLDDTYYLDFPGNPRNPGCGYERWARAHMVGHEPTTYVNVVESPELGRLAIQYWFWYVFNDFNNTHEGDWEMIQVVFDVGTVQEALLTDPVAVGYSQHSGGEFADWTDDKLTREGTHPVVFAAAGSHASKFSSSTYIAWGADSSGVGCDVTTGPSNRVEVQPIIVPGLVIDPTDPLAWTAFEGRWGERQRAFYNGPNGPYGRPRWFDPFTWQDNLRSSTLTVPQFTTFGPGPTTVFCDIVRIGSIGLTRVVVYPVAVIGILVGLIASLIVLMRIGGHTVAEAWRIYKRGWRIFVTIGLLLIPVGVLANLVQSFVIGHTPGREIFETLNSTPGARLGFVLSVGGLQQFVSLIVVGPAVIEAVAELRAGLNPTFRSVFGFVWKRIRDLLFALLRPTIIITLLSMSIVGIPWAIAKTFRWWFVAQAVIIDHMGPKEARAESERLVAGRWWRTAATGTLLLLVGIAAGPLIGIFLLVVASPSISYVNVISSFLYAFFLPLAVVGSTIMYIRRKSGESPLLPSTMPASSGAEDAANGPLPVSS